jgi:hypothetical protein
MAAQVGGVGIRKLQVGGVGIHKLLQAGAVGSSQTEAIPSLVPDELTFVTRRIESKIPSNRLRNDHGARESSRGCGGRTTSFGEIVAVGSRDAFDHPKAAEPA